jgi:ABC-2 type transport system ATP-binding protein
VILLNNVIKRYGKKAAVDGLSLKVPDGAAFGFLGQNGAGKTTTMKMIVGLASPDSGEIFIGDKPATDSSLRADLGYMPEAPYFYERLTGAEFLRFCAELFEKNLTGEESDSLLAQVGLLSAKDKAIAAYSKGMKQRLGFAQALVNDPEYILLDEPLDGLDPIGRKEIKNIIRDLRSRGKTIFFNSHILYDTEELCDEIGILHEGKLIYSGPVKEFCAGKPLEERFVETIEALSRQDKN